MNHLEFSGIIWGIHEMRSIQQQFTDKFEKYTISLP